MVNTPSTPENPHLLNAKTFGLWLDLSKRQIARLNACGKVPKPIKIGGSVRWIATEVEAWINSGCPDRETWEYQKAAAEG